MSDELAIILTKKSVEELDNIEKKLDSMMPKFESFVNVVNKLNNAFGKGSPKDFNNASKELKGVLDQVNKLQKELAESNKKLAATEQTLAKAEILRAKAQVETAKASVQEAKANEANQRAIILEAKARGANADAARKEALAEIATTRAKNNAEKQARNVASAYFNLNQQTKNAKDRAKDLGAQMFFLNDALKKGAISQKEYNSKVKDAAKEYAKARAEAINYDKAIKKIDADVGDRQRNVGNYKKGGGPTAMQFFNGLVGFNVVDRLADGIYRLGEKAVETSIKLESLRLAQKAVFKTNEEVARQNEFLVKIAERYGVEILGLTEQYTKFQASAQGTILEGDRAAKVFESVTRASAMLGLSTDNTNGILTALSQMMSKGKVQAEELRGQLGDRMAGAFKLFADGMGISTAELDALLKKGGVLTDQVLPKFAEQLDKKYFLGLGEEIETSQASLNRMNNAWITFVESIDKGGGIISGSVKGVADAVTGMLKAFTPDAALQAIRLEQEALNILGFKLRENWKDTNERKKLLNELVRLSPDFLNGLDKEKVTLGEIEDRLRGVNQQYVQKYILQEKQNEAVKLVKEEADNYKRIAKILTDNAQAYNSVSNASKDVIDKVARGEMTFGKAAQAMKNNKEEFARVRDILIRLDDVYKYGSIGLGGYTRSMNDVRNASKVVGVEFNELQKATNRVIGANGQLIDFNGLLRTSFDKLGDSAHVANARMMDAYGKARKTAMQMKENFFKAGTLKQPDGRGKDGEYWFNTVEGKNTMKSTSDYDLIDGKLVKRKTTTLPDKEKKYTGAKLDGYQKDRLMDIQAAENNQLAAARMRQIQGLIDEEKYQTEKARIITDSANKIQAYLKGINAKERKVNSDAEIKAVEALYKSQSEFLEIKDNAFNQERRNLDTQNKERRDIILSDDELTNVERTALLISSDKEYYDNLNKNYDEQIKLHQSYNRSVIKIAEDRNSALEAINSRNRENSKKLPLDMVADIEAEQNKRDSQFNIATEEAKQAIYDNNKLSRREKLYRIEKLGLEATEALLNSRKETLEKEKLIYEEKVKSNPLNEEYIKQYNKINEELSETNTKLREANKQKKELISTKEEDKFKATDNMFDFLSKGFDDLGLGGVTEQFKTMYDAILLSQDEFTKKYGDKADKWKVAEVAAIQAIGAISQSIMQDNLNRKLSLYDEELKASQSRTDAELAIIQSRLDFLNAVDNASTEQIEQRNALEDEYRVIKEQQLEREKMIAMQKAKAEQQASAQQALINGSLAATATLAQTGFAGWPMALAALAFGALQSGLIMSRNPVPQYFTGTDYASEGMAITQEYGREIITNKHGRIKSLGNERGATKTWLSAGDKVFSAKQTKEIMKSLTDEPLVMGQNIYARALSGQSLDIPHVINHNSVNADEIADKVGQKFDKTMAKYSTASVYEVDGFVYKERPGKYPEVVGKSKKQSINVKISKNGRD